MPNRRYCYCFIGIPKSIDTHSSRGKSIWEEEPNNKENVNDFPLLLFLSIHRKSVYSTRIDFQFMSLLDWLFLLKSRNTEETISIFINISRDSSTVSLSTIIDDIDQTLPKYLQVDVLSRSQFLTHINRFDEIITQLSVSMSSSMTRIFTLLFFSLSRLQTRI